MEPRISQFSSNEDRISNLSEPLIHHILSFLDMKYAVQTSVLARRWRYIWTSLPTLNFDSVLFYSSDMHTYHGFVDFVDRVLVLRDSSAIQRFHLVCEDVNSHTINAHLRTWILAAVRRNVQELSITSICEEEFEIPHCLCTCKSLIELELDMYGDFNKIVLPSSMSLPRLKYLKLGSVPNFDMIVLPSSVSLPQLKFLWLVSIPFHDENLTNMLFSSCPVLESLIMVHCEFRNMNLNISSFKLKDFKFFRNNTYDAEKDGKVKLYAPNLTSFSCHDFMSKDYYLENLSSLVTADIDMEVPIKEKVPEKYPSELLRAEKKELYAQRMMEFLRALHNVKVLTLSPWFLQVVSRAPEILDHQQPQFSNLQCLKLQTWLSGDCMHAIFYLLKKSPNIESLSLVINEKFVRGSPMYPFCDEIKLNSGNILDQWEAGLSSPCMLYHLKLVEIRGLLGRVNELKFLEILLKNAMVLDNVVLFNSTSREDSCLRERRMMKFSEKLLSFPRASARTAIFFRS